MVVSVLVVVVQKGARSTYTGFSDSQVAFLNLPVENYQWLCSSLTSSAEEAACELNEKGELSVGRRERGNSVFV